jgi:N-acetylmuramoyl-L-alanine amidase
MFLDYYEFHNQPFAAASNEAYLYWGRGLPQQLDSLTEAVLGDHGNLLLVAKSGMGKTTLLRQLLARLQKANRAVFFFDPQCNARDLLNTVFSALQVEPAGMDLTAMHKKLSEIWFGEMLAGKRFVLLVDDMDLLDQHALETLQLFSKFETSHSKFLQIVSTAEPDFVNKLEKQNLTQLHKHIAEVRHIQPLSPSETAAYIRHRLQAAGYRGNPLFDPQALAVVALQSEGIPANINKICSRALLEAYARGLRSVSADIVEKAERNLSSVIGSGQPQPINVPSVPSQSGTQKASATAIAPQLSYKASKLSAFSRYMLWAGAAAAVLFSAGLALPHGILKGMSQIISPAEKTSTINPVASVHPDGKPAQQAPVSVASRRTMNVQPGAAADQPVHNLADMIAPPAVNQDPRLSLTRELGLKINRIVIDPGHGGFDTGAKGPNGLLEKDLCLDVALRLGRMIEENIPGAQVVYTRKDDSYVPLEERTAIANAADADLFISIHANSSDIREVRGVETYYLSLATTKEAKELAIRENALTQSTLHDLPDLVKKITNNEKIAESKLLAAEIQDTLSQRLQLVSQHEKNRGVKQAPFIVLTGANMPAVLCEISFVSNANDETLLLESSQRQRIADGLYRGIAAYLAGLRGVPQDKQKLVTDNRVNILAGFARPSLDSGRNPL